MNKVRRRRLLLGAGATIVIAALLALLLMPKPVAVDIETVERGTLMVTLDHEGKTRVRERFVISAPVAGRVRRIELEPGDPVLAGETVLAVFEPTEPTLLDARTRAEAEAGVRVAEAALERARSERESARAEAELAASELDRLRPLADRNLIAPTRLDEAEAAASATRDTLQAAVSAVAAAEHSLQAARARLVEPIDGPADGAGRVIRLRSPVDGVILRRLRESESVVPTGEALLEVGDPSRLEVVADYLSADAVRMRPGMPVLIEQWGGEATLRGTVRRVEPSGFMKISALGVEEQRVNVIVDFEDPRDAWERLGDEYRVEVRVVVWERDDVLRVPTGALFREGDRWAVFVVREGRASLQAVEIGQRTGLQAEVLGGLEEGDRVIVHPPDSTEDAVRVASGEV